jgi:hypothetical protein
LLFFPPLLLSPPPLSLLLSSSPLSPLPLSASPLLSPLLSSLQSLLPLLTSLVVLSLRRPLVVSSHWLVVALPHVAPPSRRPLIPPLLSSCAGWLLRRLSSCRPLILPPSCPLLVLSLRHPLVVSSHQLVLALPLVAPPSCCPLTLPLSRCLLPAGCCVASHRAALSSCRPLVLLSSSTLNSSSLGFLEPFDVTFVVPRERSSCTIPVWPWRSQGGAAIRTRH